MKEVEIKPFVRVVKFFYPKTQKPVSLVYLIFGILLLLFYSVALYSFTDQMLNPSTSYYEYNYLVRRVWGSCLISFFGCISLLMLKRTGWVLLSFASVYGLMNSLFKVYQVGSLAFDKADYTLILNIMILAYLYFGRPVKVLNIDKRLMILPLIMAVLVYSVEYVVLFLTIDT